MAPLLNSQLRAFNTGQEGWLKQVRKASFLTTEHLARNLNISKGTYTKYEEHEQKGTITLASLARAAEAMDCELVYGLRPRNQKRISIGIWQSLAKVALEHGWLQKCDQRKRANALAYIAKKLMEDPQFKREKSWSQRANEV